jgi:hypothetical protein
MKQRDILTLMDAIAPGIAASFVRATEPLLQRLAKLEKELQDANSRVAELSEKVAADLTDEEIKRAVALIKFPTPQEIAALVPPPINGKDADPELIKQLVNEAVAAIPRIVQDGKDADPAVIKAMVDDAVKALPPAAPGKDADMPTLIKLVQDEVKDRTTLFSGELKLALPGIIGDHVEDALKNLPPAPVIDLAPLTEQIADVDKRVEAFRHALASSVTMDEVRSVVAEAIGIEGETVIGAIKHAAEEAVAALPKPKDGKDVDQEVIEALVLREVAKIPRIAGKDGDSVTIDQLAPMVAEQVNLKVAALPRAKDGVGLAGAVINRDGDLVVTMTDGSNTNLGNVLGKDGMGFEHLDVIDGEDEFVLKMQSGDRIREWTLRKPSIADHYKGVWSPGEHKRGSLVTWGGSLWMAQRDTEVKPETKDNDDWKLVVKRGRDGKDFTPTGGA